MPQKIVFMGTPDFAVASLNSIIENNIEVAAVVTAPDRKSGRGQQVNMSAVKRYAIEKNIAVLQPEKLKASEFITELEQLNADLFVVVAFRMLPEVVWSMPKKGTINLHGSLLPNYRGAAPINWAVINGEKKTGATTFFIEKEIDTGKIIDKVEIDIDKNETAGSVHDRLMMAGADLLAKTVKQILEGEVESISQESLIKGELKNAPKIFKPDCQVDWNLGTEKIHNKIRGLSPYPTAWTKIIKEGQSKTIKLFDSRQKITGQDRRGEIKIEGNIHIGTNDGWIEIIELQLEGKKRMLAKDFVKGFDLLSWQLELN